MFSRNRFLPSDKDYRTLMETLHQEQLEQYNEEPMDYFLQGMYDYSDEDEMINPYFIPRYDYSSPIEGMYKSPALFPQETMGQANLGLNHAEQKIKKAVPLPTRSNPLPPIEAPTSMKKYTTVPPITKKKQQSNAEIDEDKISISNKEVDCSSGKQTTQKELSKDSDIGTKTKSPFSISIDNNGCQKSDDYIKRSNICTAEKELTPIKVPEERNKLQDSSAKIEKENDETSDDSSDESSTTSKSQNQSERLQFAAENCGKVYLMDNSIKDSEEEEIATKKLKPTSNTSYNERLEKLCSLQKQIMSAQNENTAKNNAEEPPQCELRKSQNNLSKGDIRERVKNSMESGRKRNGSQIPDAIPSDVRGGQSSVSMKFLQQTSCKTEPNAFGKEFVQKGHYIYDCRDEDEMPTTYSFPDYGYSVPGEVECTSQLLEIPQQEVKQEGSKEVKQKTNRGASISNNNETKPITPLPAHVSTKQHDSPLSIKETRSQEDSTQSEEEEMSTSVKIIPSKAEKTGGAEFQKDLERSTKLTNEITPASRSSKEKTQRNACKPEEEECSDSSRSINSVGQKSKSLASRKDNGLNKTYCNETRPLSIFSTPAKSEARSEADSVERENCPTKKRECSTKLVPNRKELTSDSSYKTESDDTESIDNSSIRSYYKSKSRQSPENSDSVMQKENFVSRTNYKEKLEKLCSFQQQILHSQEESSLKYSKKQFRGASKQSENVASKGDIHERMKNSVQIRNESPNFLKNDYSRMSGIHSTTQQKLLRVSEWVSSNNGEGQVTSEKEITEELRSEKNDPYSSNAEKLKTNEDEIVLKLKEQRQRDEVQLKVLKSTKESLEEDIKKLEKEKASKSLEFNKFLNDTVKTATLLQESLFEEMEKVRKAIEQETKNLQAVTRKRDELLAQSKEIMCKTDNVSQVSVRGHQEINCPNMGKPNQKNITADEMKVCIEGTNKAPSLLQRNSKSSKKDAVGLKQLTMPATTQEISQDNDLMDNTNKEINTINYKNNTGLTSFSKYEEQQQDNCQCCCYGNIKRDKSKVNLENELEDSENFVREQRRLLEGLQQEKSLLIKDVLNCQNELLNERELLSNLRNEKRLLDTEIKSMYGAIQGGCQIRSTPCKCRDRCPMQDDTQRVKGFDALCNGRCCFQETTKEAIRLLRRSIDQLSFTINQSSCSNHCSCPSVYEDFYRCRNMCNNGKATMLEISELIPKLENLLIKCKYPEDDVGVGNQRKKQNYIQKSKSKVRLEQQDSNPNSIQHLPRSEINSERVGKLETRIDRLCVNIIRLLDHVGNIEKNSNGGIKRNPNRMNGI